MSEQGPFPIREVARLTGVNPVTLRAWQRRYGLLKPLRAPSGHRLYSTTDIEQIRHILHWLEQGVAISQVKAILAQPEPTLEASNWERAQQALNQDASELNLARLEHRLRELSQLYPAELLLRHIIEPWLQQLACLKRPDQPVIEQSVQALLSRMFSQLLTLQEGPRCAVVRVGNVASLSARLLQYELQGLECPSADLGLLSPKQLSLATERLKLPAYIILIGPGISAGTLREYAPFWPDNSFFVGPFALTYQPQNILTHPISSSVSSLARDHHDFFSLVQKRS